jgi:hypothetical protein
MELSFCLARAMFFVRPRRETTQIREEFSDGKIVPISGGNGCNEPSSAGRIKNCVSVHGKMSHNPLACHPFRRVRWRLAVSDGNGVVRKDAPSQNF